MSLHHMSGRRAQPPSRELPASDAHPAHQLARRLSTEEETLHHLAAISRRKSSERVVREDLRLKLGHSNVLDLLLQDIAKRSPPPSPTQHAAQPERRAVSVADWTAEIQQKPSSSSSSPPPTRRPSGVDEYGFAYDDGSEEDDDDAGLTLTRTVSRRPQR